MTVGVVQGILALAHPSLDHDLFQSAWRGEAFLVTLVTDYTLCRCRSGLPAVFNIAGIEGGPQCIQCAKHSFQHWQLQTLDRSDRPTRPYESSGGSRTSVASART